MAFLETPRFPVDINYGSRGGPMFSTDVVTYGNGIEYRNANWSTPLAEYDVKYSIKNRTQLVNIYEFFMANLGAFDGFRVKDLWDFTSASDGKSSVAQDDQIIGTGDGSEVDFQLVKNYTKGGNSTSRVIKKPVSGTVLVEVNSVLKTEGVDYTIDYTTGIVTFTSPVTNTHVIKAGFQFDVPCRFGTDDLSNLAMVAYSTGGVDIGSLDSIPLLELRNP